MRVSVKKIKIWDIVWAIFLSFLAGGIVAHILTIKQQEDIICDHICNSLGYEDFRVFNLCNPNELENCYVYACECKVNDTFRPLKDILGG